MSNDITNLELELVEDNVELELQVENKLYVKWGDITGDLSSQQDLKTILDNLSAPPTKLSELENDSGYLTEHQDLSDYATKEYVDNKQVDLSNYYSKSENDNLLNEKANKSELEEVKNNSLKLEEVKNWVNEQNYLTQHQSLDNYVSKQELNNYHDITKQDVIQDLEDIRNNAKNGAKLSEVQDWVLKQGYLTNHQDLSDYATKEYVDNKQVDLSNYYTKQEIEDKQYLTEHQDISNLVTNDELNAKGYLTQHQSLDNYYTKSEVEQQIANIQPSEVDLSGYYTKTNVDDLLNNKLDNNALVSYATKDYVDNKQIDLSNYYTKQDIEDKGYLTQHQDISTKADKTYVDEQIANIPQTDLSNYYNKQEIDNKGYLTNHQSLENYATKEYVDNKQTDLSNYYTKQDIEDKQYIQEHQSLEEYATKEFVNEQIANIQSSEVDLSDYYTKTEIDNKEYLTEHQDISAKADKSEVNKHFVVSANANALFNSTDHSIELNDNFIDVNDTYYALKDIKVGDLFFTIEENVPSRFCSQVHASTFPEGYTELTYIQTQGSQWIDTLIPPTEGIKCETKMNILGAGGNGLFGVGGDDSWGTYMGRDCMWDNYNDDHSVSIRSGYTGVLIFKKDGNKTYINNLDNTINIKIENRTKTYPTNDTRPILISRKNSRGCSIMRINYFKLWDKDNTPLFDGVPAKRNSDGVLGMLDLISGNFFENAGSGVFLSGVELSNTATLLTI